MAARLGVLVIARLRKDETCFFCRETIEAGVLAARISGKRKNWWFTSKMHVACVHSYIDDKVENYTEKPAGRPKFDMDEETRKSRKKAQNGIGRYRGLLTEAYEAGDNEWVARCWRYLLLWKERLEAPDNSPIIRVDKEGFARDRDARLLEHIVRDLGAGFTNDEELLEMASKQYVLEGVF